MASSQSDGRADGRADDKSDELICLGVITGSIGVRGEVRVKIFTETIEGIGAYGALIGEPGGACLEISGLRPARGGAAVRLAGVDDRNAADALKGVQLCVPRSALGNAGDGLEDADSFFHVDLIGLEARNEAGGVVGSVKAVHDFGGGDILEIVGPEIAGKDGGSEMIPFLKETVPLVDLKAGYLVIIPPQLTGEDA